jgi:8-oxo-dGTP pyrophosphatase MutT (NUDIX family)
MKMTAALRGAIAATIPLDAEEAAMQTDMITFLDRYVDSLFRTQQLGHFTASGWVVDLATQSVLLIHHRKLDRWLQPGGHADGDADLLAVAQREVFEETGLQTTPLTDGIFDLDIHEIPQRGDVPTHLHLDVRYLLTPVEGATLQLNHEVKAARWVPLHQVGNLSQERSLMRMVDKSLAQMPKIMAGRPM